MSDPRSKATLEEGSGVTSIAESLTENAIKTAEEAIIEEMEPPEENPPPPIENPPSPVENPLPPIETPPPPAENPLPPAETPPPTVDNPPLPGENPIPTIENPLPPIESPPPQIENIFDNTEATVKVSNTELPGPQGLSIPTVLVDMAGNVSFEGNADGQPIFIPIANASTSGVNVMLPVQAFPSMSVTAMQIQAPESFARHNTIPMESEVGLPSVRREGAKSNIGDGTTFSSVPVFPSNNEALKSSSGLVVIGVSIHLSQQAASLPVAVDEPLTAEASVPVPAEVIQATSSYAKATSSDPHVLVVVDGEDPSASSGIPVRRTQSTPTFNTRRRSILEKLPEEARTSLRYQLQEIHIHLTLLMQELIRAEDQVLKPKNPPDDKQ